MNPCRDVCGCLDLGSWTSEDGFGFADHTQPLWAWSGFRIGQQRLHDPALSWLADDVVRTEG